MQMRSILFALAFSTINCGRITPDYTSGGIHFYWDHPYPVKAINQAVKILYSVPKSKKVFKALRVELMADRPVVPPHGEVSGFYSPTSARIGIWMSNDELGRTSFFHEGMHRIRDRLWKLPIDYRHKDEKAWDWVEKMKQCYRDNDLECQANH